MTREQVLKRALRILDSQAREMDVLAHPAAVRNYLRLKLLDRPYEAFVVVFLNAQHRVIAFEEMFRGTLDQAAVYPREVVREVIQRNAAAVILAHNHPSGVAEPSQADELITKRLREALGLIDVRLLDHFVIAGGQSTSFAERGLL